MINFLTSQQQLNLPLWGLVFFAIAAMFGVLPRSERALRGLTTYIHEMSHALTAIMLGRRVSAIKVDSWLGGHTSYIGKKNIGNIVVSWSGYAAPGIVTIIVAFAYAAGLTNLLSAITMIILLSSILLQRSVFGVFATLMALIFFLLILLEPNGIITLIVVFTTLGLLVGNGISAVFLLKKVRQNTKATVKNEAQITDSEFLQKSTKIPARIWEYSWILFILASIVAFSVVVLLMSY
jgi:hypothetical protein